MANIRINVTETGVAEANRDLDSLRRTGARTNRQVRDVESSLSRFGRNGAAAIALVDGPMGGVSSRLTQLTKILGYGPAGLATVAAAGAAGLYALSAAISTTVVAQDNLARVSGLTIEELRNSGFAVEQYGLDVQAMGDGFKDAKERIGDFINTLGGPLQDFADAMGMSADETLAFANSVIGLSGKEILVKMVSDLEDAGKTSEQMSHALEGMASDMTLLLPLLRDGGSEFERLEQRMAEVTNPLSKEDVKLYREMKESVDLVSGSFLSWLENAITPMLPAMTSLNEKMAHFLGTMNEGSEAALAEELVDLTEKAANLEEEIENVESVIGRLKSSFSSDAPDTSWLKDELAEVNKTIEETRRKLSDIRVGVNYDTDSPIPEKKLTSSAAITGSSDKAAEELLKKQEAYEKELASVTALYASKEDLSLTQFNSEIARIESLDLAHDDARSLQESALQAHSDRILSIKQDAADSELRIDEALADSKKQLLSDGVSILGAVLGEQNALYKAAATAEATIAAYTAANKALAAFPPPMSYIAAGVAVTAGLANVAKINSTRFQGGQVSAGSEYGWQERGGEAFIPNIDGKVFSKNDMKGMMNGDGSGVTVVNNIYNQTDSSVTSRPNESGGSDIYITRDEFPSLLAAEAGNPDSMMQQSQSGTYSMQRN